MRFRALVSAFWLRLNPPRVLHPVVAQVRASVSHSNQRVDAVIERLSILEKRLRDAHS